MDREFVRLPEFERQCKNIGMTEDDIKEIESELLINPQVGAVMRGTGGLRKLRFALSIDKGKSGGARVVYIDFMFYEKIYLITAFAKNEIENLRKAERNELKKLVEILENKLRKGR